jgi:serralysin
MATVSDLTTTPLSGLNHIDALLDSGPDWNYMLPANNTITYTFSTTSGNEDGKTGQVAFSASQQAAARGAFSGLAQLTGIKFVETAVGTDAQIHLANTDVTGATTTGLCSWQAPYTYDGNTHAIISFKPQAWVYLDNNEWRAQNQDLTPGGYGYETLLHELGHALGLKHPFDTENNSVTLPASQDNTSVTLMSYHYQGGPYSTYNQDDVAALNWLYGADGLGGALGINSTTGGRYITGTSGADVLTGTSANDFLDGGAGSDAAVFSGQRSNYAFTELPNGDVKVVDHTGADGTDTVRSIETFKFNAGIISASRADVLGLDTTPPAAPTLKVSVNENGYTLGNEPQVTGGAEANATITLYDAGHHPLGTVKADANGLWSASLDPMADGVGYTLSATATDAAGNVSTATESSKFSIDTDPPTTPTATATVASGGNNVTMSGTGESGTTIMVVLNADVDLATAQVVDGHWSVTTAALPNGNYSVSAVSVDLADNATSADKDMVFSVDSKANITGTAGNDKLTLTAGNNAVTGGDGLDTVVVNGLSTNFTVAKEIWGHDLTDKVGNGGQDHLMGVERIQFNDTAIALDLDGVGGMAYRLYKAAFDRTPDLEGLGYWIDRFDHGAAPDLVASEFLKAPEFQQKYGTNPTTQEYVSHLYANVLHRTPDPTGYNYWVTVLDTHQTTREHVLAFFGESPENQAGVIDLIQNGITYTPWHG